MIQRFVSFCEFWITITIYLDCMADENSSTLYSFSVVCTNHYVYTYTHFRPWLNLVIFVQLIPVCTISYKYVLIVMLILDQYLVMCLLLLVLSLLIRNINLGFLSLSMLTINIVSISRVHSIFETNLLLAGNPKFSEIHLGSLTVINKCRTSDFCDHGGFAMIKIWEKL